jgi:hypothetical protein
MIMSKHRLVCCLGAGVIAVLVFSSCASNPPPAAVSAAGGDFAYLAPGGSAYFYTDVRLSRSILENLSVRGVDMTRIGRFWDKVDFLSGALYPNGESRRLLLHAWRQKGKVPSASALFLSAKWEKTASPTGRSYYHSKSYGFSVSTQGSHAFVSDADPFVPEPFVTMPDGLAELQWEAVILGWLDNAGTPINNFLSLAGAPVHVPTNRILFGIYRSQPDMNTEMADAATEDPVLRAAGAGESLYELRLRVETQNANQAKALATLLALVRVFVEKPESNLVAEHREALRPLLANPPSQDGQDLVISAGPMSAGEIALLFNRFSVYSQQTTL